MYRMGGQYVNDEFMGNYLLLVVMQEQSSAMVNPSSKENGGAYDLYLIIKIFD